MATQSVLQTASSFACLANSWPKKISRQGAEAQSQQSRKEVAPKSVLLCALAPLREALYFGSGCAGLCHSACSCNSVAGGTGLVFLTKCPHRPTFSDRSELAHDISPIIRNLRRKRLHGNHLRTVAGYELRHRLSPKLPFWHDHAAPNLNLLLIILKISRGNDLHDSTPRFEAVLACLYSRESATREL
jgi:hypothetical protein